MLHAVCRDLAGLADGRLYAEHAIRPGPGDRRLLLHYLEKRLVWSNPAVFGQKQQIQQTVKHQVELSETERAIRIKELLDRAASRQLDVEVHDDEPSDAER